MGVGRKGGQWVKEGWEQGLLGGLKLWWAWDLELRVLQIMG
jgi:hypothetical protein